MTTLSPVDLLTLTPGEQAVLRCLTKWPRLTLRALTQRSGLSLEEAEVTVNDLLREKRIAEQLHQGERVFSVRFQFRRRAVRNMPTELRRFFRRSVANCLAESALTKKLPEEVHNQILRSSQKRSLMPDEVLAWQGESFPYVALIEDGLLMQTRLRGNRVSQKQGYLQRTDWFGLIELFSQSTVADTYKAVTETTVRYWDSAEFHRLIEQHSGFAIALSHYFSNLLSECDQAKINGQTKLWAIDGSHHAAGVTTLAFNLAKLAQKAEAVSEPRTLLWVIDPPLFLQKGNNRRRRIADIAHVHTHPSGIDVLSALRQNDFPTQVELDIVLTELTALYETIIFDTGAELSDERMLRLRGKAQTLITLTCDRDSAETTAQRWGALQAYAMPGQKRVLALNRAKTQVTNIDARFHLVLPDDPTAFVDSTQVDQLNGRLNEAFMDVYRRLSLNHALAIFVPSTLDVDEAVDNAEQVQSALSFFGDTFGGATSSDAEGVWRSEDSSLVTEQVTIVRTFVSKHALDQHLDEVISFASDLKRDMRQEAVAISVDNQMLLV